MPSRSEELFAQIMANPLAWITAAVATGEPESEVLDFKQVAPQEQRNKENWAKSLSGFANTGGGVIVWGVDCRPVEQPDGTKLDVANSLHPVEYPAAFAEKLRKLLLNALSEPVQGVEAVPVPIDGGGGYVVCHVPEGTLKPYRSEVDQKYYQRVQDSFVVISHALLRSLFYPKSSSILRLNAYWIEGGHLRFDVTNKETATARDVTAFVMLSKECEIKGSDTKEVLVTPKGRKLREFPANGVASNINPSNLRAIMEFAPPPLTKQGRQPMLAAVNFYMADQEPQGWLIKLPQNYAGPYTDKNGLSVESTVIDVLNDW